MDMDVATVDMAASTTPLESAMLMLMLMPMRYIIMPSQVDIEATMDMAPSTTPLESGMLMPMLYTIMPSQVDTEATMDMAPSTAPLESVMLMLIRGKIVVNLYTDVKYIHTALPPPASWAMAKTIEKNC